MSDDDQSWSDADQTASETDATSSGADQSASDRDQATADREIEDAADHTDLVAYELSRIARQKATLDRRVAARERAGSAEGRGRAASERDQTATVRDEAALLRDERAQLVERTIISSDEPLARKLQQLRVQAAADRAQATLDRRRAASDRAQAALERARLDLAVITSHLDGLTGAYRREMGDLVLSNEIARARRADGRFVLAFIDVDGLKLVNDRDGHAAGDQVLRAVVGAIRSKVRSFDPVVRYGGDEFVCGLGGTNLEEAGHRLDAIGKMLEVESIAISFGLAALRPHETRQQLTARADAALLEAKSQRHQ